ncbi:MAG: alpha/beta fold hydrolase [Acidimicrobiales bacterium]
MTVVFVHGNPETAAIWNELLDALRAAGVERELIALSPPGFGAPVPEGFDPVAPSYREWLTAELEAIVATAGAVDLVGHDWGGGHVVPVALDRQDLIRSWCVDVLGLFHPDYVWHDMAQVWRTPGDGEENIAGMMGTPTADLAMLYESLGMPPAVAADVAAGAGDEMGRCILSLYRSAEPAYLAEIGARLGDNTRPALAVCAENDTYVGSRAQIEEMAGLANARTVHLAGVGHWWMLEDPAAGAAVLASFWSSLE